MPPVPAPSLPSGAAAQKPVLGSAADADGSPQPPLLSLLPSTSEGASGFSEEAAPKERGRRPSQVSRQGQGRGRGRGRSRSQDLKPGSLSPTPRPSQNSGSSRWTRTGMAASTVLGAGLARILFYPTLLYTLVRDKVSGRGHRDWYHRIDSTVLLGALPLRSLTRRLIEKENVRGVITMNEEYETRFLCNTFEEWKALGVEQLRLSTVDMTGVPTLENLKKGVQFTLKYVALEKCVYVHCKAGRSRSATMVAAYLMQVYKWNPEEAVGAIARIRSHIHIRPGQVEVLKEFHEQLMAEAEKTKASQEVPGHE
ncbi:LOW QUALITY PROTEIN: phosphatidylglycerophosphatase and protein-tyrosine phosphatase 1 [Phascolarctos cinereus]|uniref:Phosphatidylglycerophosphatase and protein-tyrosine phosphatase 1 n=1 Tax=Phascolarctos cinereus TaxID=38626 RepID=A0A6P5M468_PHACI|nr:LOW QUALITY PROTEIN: phosphatidylglycerophosphatase and protein-tyrosine phosphatase 1 [Phascolarctos cinereus]